MYIHIWPLLASVEHSQRLFSGNLMRKTGIQRKVTYISWVTALSVEALIYWLIKAAYGVPSFIGFLTFGWFSHALLDVSSLHIYSSSPRISTSSSHCLLHLLPYPPTFLLLSHSPFPICCSYQYLLQPGYSWCKRKHDVFVFLSPGHFSAMLASSHPVNFIISFFFPAI